MAKKRKSTRRRRRAKPSYWVRYDYQRTKSSGGERLCVELLTSNSVSCTVPGPCTLRDQIEQIALRADTPIPIDLLEPCLSEWTLSRGSTYFGPPDKYFTAIAMNYPDMRWWITKKGLRMELVPASATSVSTFEQVAGKLMFDARSSQLNRRIPKAEYIVVAKQLADFALFEYLPKPIRKTLGEWNQKHQTRPIRTFSAAIEAKQPPKLRRAVQLVLYGAETKYRLNPAPRIGHT